MNYDVSLLVNDIKLWDGNCGKKIVDSAIRLCAVGESQVVLMPEIFNVFFFLFAGDGKKSVVIVASIFFV